jgi:hypothetical protein
VPEFSHGLERQALTGHETSAVTTQFDEGVHGRAFGKSQAAAPDGEPATKEEVAMPTITALQTTATKHWPILIQPLPFSPEPISPVVASMPPPDSRFAFKLGAWERLVVAAELDRESRWLSPST